MYISMETILRLADEAGMSDKGLGRLKRDLDLYNEGHKARPVFGPNVGPVESGEPLEYHQVVGPGDCVKKTPPGQTVPVLSPIGVSKNVPAYPISSTTLVAPGMDTYTTPTQPELKGGG